MAPIAPQVVVLPVSYRRQFVRRRRPLLRGLGRFGLVPQVPRFLGPPVRACPDIIEAIPPGCTAQITYNAAGCPIRTPVCPPGAGFVFPGPAQTRPLPPCPASDPLGLAQGCSATIGAPCPPCQPLTPQQPPVISTNGTAGTPVPPGFPTNQFFVAPDGSVWEYSQTRHAWMNTGTPYNVNAPVPVSAAPATTTVPTPPPPVSVSVAPPAVAPALSPYQSIIDFATQDTLIHGLPNWLTGLGVFIGVKAVMNKFGSRR